MSIEKTLQDLTTAINNLASAFADKQALAPKAPVITSAGAVQHFAVAAAPVQQPTPSSVIAQPAAPAMPPPPTFVMPTAAPAPVAPTVPFADPKGLLQYVMDAYKAMGPQKGAGIQNVLTSLGVGNINDVKAEQYAALYAGVEQLKQGA